LIFNVIFIIYLFQAHIFSVGTGYVLIEFMKTLRKRKTFDMTAL